MRLEKVYNYEVGALITPLEFQGYFTITIGNFKFCVVHACCVYRLLYFFLIKLFYLKILISNTVWLFLKFDLINWEMTTYNIKFFWVLMTLSLIKCFFFLVLFFWLKKTLKIIFYHIRMHKYPSAAQLITIEKISLPNELCNTLVDTN